MKRKISPEDLRLWQAQLKGVKPLSKAEKTPEAPPLSKEQKSPQHPPRSLEKKLAGPKPALPLQTFGRKERRRLTIGGRLDMHGMSMMEAHEALEKFLNHAQTKGFKIVLVITGKGALTSENTLRHQLPRWIKEPPFVSLIASFHSPAKPQDGGGGACYIGVRKRKVKAGLI